QRPGGIDNIVGHQVSNKLHGGDTALARFGCVNPLAFLGLVDTPQQSPGQDADRHQAWCPETPPLLHALTVANDPVAFLIRSGSILIPKGSDPLRTEKPEYCEVLES